MISKTEFRVRYSETDGQRRAHHSHFPVWFEMGRADFCRSSGFNYRKMEDNGLFLVVARLSCRYAAPLEYDDLVCVETWLSSISRKIMTFDYLVRNLSTGQIAGSGSTTLVCVDPKGDPRSFPEGVLELLSPKVLKSEDLPTNSRADSSVGRAQLLHS